MLQAGLLCILFGAVVKGTSGPLTSNVPVSATLLLLSIICILEAHALCDFQ